MHTLTGWIPDEIQLKKCKKLATFEMMNENINRGTVNFQKVV